MKKTLIIFGGADFEEAAARKVATEAGLIVATATVDGKKVHGGNAYQANGYTVDQGDATDITGIIIFECAKKCAGENANIFVVCDHHNPDDAGYGKGPDEFFSASSLGQLMNFLGIEPDHEQMLIAASDHCPVAAYAGKCPGITVEEFADFRITQKLAFYKNDARNAHKNTKEMLTGVIAQAKEKLLKAPEVNGVRDVRSAGHIDELPEAAMLLGTAYMASIPDTDRDQKPTGNIKVVLGGNTTPEIVTAFMEWGNSLPNKVGNAYGNPTRGFAGVITTPEQ